MSADKHLQSWQERFEMAEAMQPLLGKLYRNQGVEVVVYGKPLLNASTIEIIKAHRLVRRHVGELVSLPLNTGLNIPIPMKLKAIWHAN